MSSSSSPSMTHGQQLRRSRHHLLSLDCRCRISHSCWHLALEKAANLISSSASAARSLQISNSRRQPLSRFSSSAYTSTRRGTTLAVIGPCNDVLPCSLFSMEDSERGFHVRKLRHFPHGLALAVEHPIVPILSD
uniref:Uncharacterized protein n=1 Tax=Oryza sativa subsp. japonica TaxID=39947 RepID=Q650V9_ORYSJ|nr:hypothetical protein [Oryza sativa Japonica Group]BAD46658.1 hypothetical protein [Oryza sativa Japonica Group]